MKYLIKENNKVSMLFASSNLKCKWTCLGIIRCTKLKIRCTNCESVGERVSWAENWKVPIKIGWHLSETEFSFLDNVIVTDMLTDSVNWLFNVFKDNNKRTSSFWIKSII